MKTPFDESQATWNQSSTGVDWESPGASGTSDRESTDMGSVSIAANEAIGVEKQITLSSAQIQEMVNGTFTNNGFIIVADTELNDRFNYRSSDASNASQRPKLVIQYTTSPTAIPTPTPTVTPSPTATETPSATPAASDTPSPTPTIAQTPPPQGPVTITYDYDPLSRLAAADYTINGSPSDYYHYSYDAVGNRLLQTSSVLGLPSTINYVYDNANRLTSVNGVTYTWDNNGNLLNDGVNTYTYDSANRLKTLTGSSVSANYTYNGLGDRLQETLNGQTTTFTMDLNMGLTQALSDGTNTYVYGIDRIAQVNVVSEYFLGDALGSVRQMASDSGAITYARAYDPYGVVTTTGGASSTAYGYTGEYTSNKLVYLRARHYAPYIGRFLTRDTFGGNPGIPASLNRFNYVHSNPVMYTDPSGQVCVPCLIAFLIALGVFTQGCSSPPSPVALTPVVSTPTLPFTPTSTSTPTPTATSTPTATFTPTFTPTPTSIELAISYLQYSPTGQASWNYLVSIGNDRVEYNPSTDPKEKCAGHGGKPIVVAAESCGYSPTYIAGTIAHEAFHIKTPGDSLWEEYQAFMIGDIVRSEIVQAGLGTTSDLRFPLSKYTVNLNNSNKTQLAKDLEDWFYNNGLGIYPDPKPQGYGVPTLP